MCEISIIHGAAWIIHIRTKSCQKINFSKSFSLFWSTNNKIHRKTRFFRLRKQNLFFEIKKSISDDKNKIQRNSPNFLFLVTSKNYPKTKSYREGHKVSSNPCWSPMDSPKVFFTSKWCSDCGMCQMLHTISTIMFSGWNAMNIISSSTWWRPHHNHSWCDLAKLISHIWYKYYNDACKRQGIRGVSNLRMVWLTPTK